MKKKAGSDKQDKGKKMIAVRMSPGALELLQEFSGRFPGMSQAGILEVGLYHLKEASDTELKELFLTLCRGIKNRARIVSNIITSGKSNGVALIQSDILELTSS